MCVCVCLYRSIYIRDPHPSSSVQCKELACHPQKAIILKCSRWKNMEKQAHYNNIVI